MATQLLCLFNKYGYCKHGDRCRKRHVNEICEKSSCDMSTCNSRHPNICKFYRDLGRCKFYPCAFLHKNNSLDRLKKQNDEVLDKIAKLDEKIKDLDIQIIESKLCVEKLQSVENKLDKFKALECESYRNDSLLRELNCKVTAIENTLDEKDKIIKNLMEKIAVLENRQDSIENETNEVTELEQTFFNPSH